MPGRLRDPIPGVADAALHARMREHARSREDAAGDYEEWTVARLRRRAAELGVVGRSAMRKAELVAALRER